MSTRRVCISILMTSSSIALSFGPVTQVQAAKLNLEFRPPAVPTNKSNGPGDVPGWSALVLMFSGPVTAAQFKIDNSPCPEFMDVPGFTGPSDTVTIVPPPPAPDAPGYRIPVGKLVTVMVTSDQPVTLKPSAGSPPTPTFWRYKGNNADTRNVAARAIPEPATAMLLMFAAPLCLRHRLFHTRSRVC